jgi:hypothetical protein
MPQPHGTINRYNNQRCRCDLCRAAIRDYRRAQRAQTTQAATRHRAPAAAIASGQAGGAPNAPTNTVRPLSQPSIQPRPRRAQNAPRSLAPPKHDRVDDLPAAFRPVPAQRPEDALPAWARPFTR